MGFWLFMLGMDMLVPFTMIGFGKKFSNCAPDEMNAVYGYRTNMSMKSKETWEFAHKYCGKIWYVFGVILLPLTVVPMLFVIGESEDIVGTQGGIICMIQLIPFIGSIIPTEVALRKAFDKNGRRR